MADQLGLLADPDNDMLRTAVLSECGTYRYELRRGWGRTGNTCGWIMLNPSTATADVDDPTIRRCISFARSWGYDGIVVRNLYAARATNPRGLRDFDDPVGPANGKHLARCAEDAITVLAWGANADPFTAQGVVGHLIVAGIADRLHCLGLTKAGFPRHPLYVKGDTRPIPFDTGRTEGGVA